MTPKELLEKAMASARKEAGKEKDKVKADVVRVTVFTNVILDKLNRLLKNSRTSLSPFEKEIMSTFVDLRKLRNDRRQTKESMKIIRRLRDEYKLKVKYSRNYRESGDYRREYYGRVKSVVKKLDFREMEKFHAVLPKIPKVKERPTVIIAGPPNVGKSEFLKNVSGRKVEVRPYPFTTKNILIGTSKHGLLTVQWIDTPGLLDRPAEKRNKIEKRAVAALKHVSKNILFLVDPSEYCGMSLERQLSLAKKIKEEMKPCKMIILATHGDVTKEKPEDAMTIIDARDEKQVKETAEKIVREFFGQNF